MVLTGYFEKFLKVVLRLPRLALEIMLDGRDVLLIGVVCFLVITIVACSDCNALGVPLLPLLAALCTFPSVLGGGFGSCYTAATIDCFHVHQNESGPNHLFARSVLGGDAHQLLGGARLSTSKLMHQGTVRHSGPEHRDDIGVSHPRELWVMLHGCHHRLLSRSPE
jgi:hypothetical protein